MPETSLFWGNCGDAYRMTGDYEHALEYLEKAASMAPDDPFNFYALGKVYWEKGLSSDEKEREEYVRNSEYSFRKAQSLAPENARYIKDMGDMYFHFGYFNEAADSFRKAVEMEPENSGLYDAVGLSCYHLGEFSDAVEWFSTSLEYADDTGEILNSIGLCYFEMGNFEKAQSYFKQASDTDPQNSVFLDNVFLTQYKILGIGEYPHGG